MMCRMEQRATYSANPSASRLIPTSTVFLVTNARGPEIRTKLYMNGPHAEEEFAALEKQKGAIEKGLGFR